MHGNDPISMLRDIGPATVKKLHDANIHAANDIIVYGALTLVLISTATWSKIHSNIPTLANDIALLSIDHSLSPNLCQSLHRDDWEKKISIVSRLSGVMDIRVAMKHVHLHCVQLFRNSPDPM